MPTAMDCGFGNTFWRASYSDEQVMPTVVAGRWRAGKPAAAHASE